LLDCDEGLGASASGQLSGLLVSRRHAITLNLNRFCVGELL
jgi:hypothetical protein